MQRIGPFRAAAKDQIECEGQEPYLEFEPIAACGQSSGNSYQKVYKGMKKYFIGIDFSKEKFDVALIARETEGSSPVEKGHGVYGNDRKGFRSFERRVRSLCAGACPSEVLFCGEDTGRYSEALAGYLYGLGYDVWLESPLRMKHSMGIRRAKDDRADAQAIAAYAMRFADKAMPYTPMSPALHELRELFSYRMFLVRQKKAVAVRAAEVRETDSRRERGTSFACRSAKRMEKQMDREIMECNERIRALINSDPELAETYRIVTSVKGIGQQNATALILCTRNFTRFDNPRQLACYCGIAPFARQSGTSLHSPAHNSPLADRQMKALLSEAAKSAVMFNPVMKSYYQRLIERGKHPGVALNNVKNKLVHTVMAMVRNKTVFDERYSYQFSMNFNIKQKIMAYN